MYFSLALLSIRSLTRSLQSTEKRCFQEETKKHNKQQKTDIATYRLNPPRGRFNENKIFQHEGGAIPKLYPHISRNYDDQNSNCHIIFCVKAVSFCPLVWTIPFLRWFYFSLLFLTFIIPTDWFSSEEDISPKLASGRELYTNLAEVKPSHTTQLPANNQSMRGWLNLFFGLNRTWEKVMFCCQSVLSQLFRPTTYV